MKSAVVLFTRDLRLHDNPTLRAALDASETVLPLFVLDEGITGTRYGAAANRRADIIDAFDRASAQVVSEVVTRVGAASVEPQAASTP